MKADTAHETVVRFGPMARIEHASVILLFLVLAVTGLPQKWPELGASVWLVDLFGGVFATRAVHRLAGVLFSLLTVAHLVRVTSMVLTRRVEPALFVTAGDFRDAYENLRYYLGRTESPPQFDRYDYRQKFEYWGLIFGSTVMVVSGLILYFPVLFARLLPAELIPVSKVAHSNEALLAMLIIIVWHLYGAHLNPEVFPFDSSIFTGRITKQRLAEEHALEYRRLFGDADDEGDEAPQAAEPEAGPEPSPRPPG